MAVLLSVTLNVTICSYDLGLSACSEYLNC